MRSDTIVGYTFAAAQFCPEHIVAQLTTNPGDTGHAGAAIGNPEAHLDLLARLAGVNRHDEDTFDTGEFPKVIFYDQTTPDDTCDAGHPLLAD